MAACILTFFFLSRMVFRGKFTGKFIYLYHFFPSKHGARFPSLWNTWLCEGHYYMGSGTRHTTVVCQHSSFLFLNVLRNVPTFYQGCMTIIIGWITLTSHRQPWSSEDEASRLWWFPDLSSRAPMKSTFWVFSKMSIKWMAQSSVQTFMVSGQYTRITTFYFNQCTLCFMSKYLQNCIPSASAVFFRSY